MQRTRTWMFALMAGGLAFNLGAAPATPTYINVEAAIARVQQAWATPGVTPDPNAPGWNALFDAIRRDLVGYTTAKSEDDRLRALGRLYQITAALDAVSWEPAFELRNELRTWLRPRIVLAWASRRLVATVQGLPPAPDANLQGNRERWVTFVGNDLGSALRDYEAAGQVRERRVALGKVYSALSSIHQGNQAHPWGPSVELEFALDDLYNGPNLQATADAPSVSSRLANYVVESGPVYRNGQTTYVTAGPYLGFGLMASDDGIIFFNRQALSSVTPINGFQQQVNSDPQGRRAAKLYQFDATSTDQSVLTVVAVLRPSGLQLFPDNTHATNATVGSAPQPGKGLGRGIASLIGLNQYKITEKVHDGAIDKIRQQVAQGAREEATERSARRASQTNATLANVFSGPDKLVVKTIEIDGLRLRSRPEFVIVDGRVAWRDVADQFGAEMPKPWKFFTAGTGVSADVQIASVMNNLTRGYLQTDPVKSVNNLMIVTRKVPPGAPAKEGITVSENVDFARFVTAVNDARAANDPKVMAIRVKKPGQPPEFSVDRNGFLVAIVRDFSLEVPAPEAAAKGGLAGPAAKIYRIEAPAAEFAISFQVTPASNNLPMRFVGRIESFDPGPGARVLAINDDETKALPLTAFTSAFVLNVFGSRLKGQPIDAPLSNLNIPGFNLTSVSAIDPTGWMRVTMTPIAR
ncbi:MAG: hypothetical protein JWN86_4488 [Planctomycetota bacterium]|nr:hypothetical protein [Planctomycetota bacterium]